MSLLKETVEKIGLLDKAAMGMARERIDALVKPIGSLGRLEDLAVQLSGITGELYPKVDKKVVVVMAADHGVYHEGIAPNPQIITAIQTPNFVKGVTGVCALAKQAGSDVVIVDVGIAVDMDYPGVINRKIRYGTDNMAIGPAMTKEEAIKSIEIGIEIATQEINKGKNLIATGEMGIGNTTASTAIIAAVGGLDPMDIVGVGAGLPVEKLSHKGAVIKKALEINEPNSQDGVDLLAKVGGFEIGGMAGTFLAAAANNIPVVVDGVISTAAALIAVAIEPKVKQFLIPSHGSAEKVGKKALGLLGLEPFFDLGFRLGEGSGAVLAFNFVEAATYMMKEMITLEESGITL